ncbi:hypothetical protein [Zavarzinia compransoris]|uniref:Uncharacterized protein n=1 Tax=Zavarzinia compransoris TaxID=1264899 RepID=A0A317ED09_9PROT|nr:hypothetical protein [Zavarzinia compransoris]PWR23243.1 hypothetical protein DKG75_01345 [Zavarzinia compransoris]TDP46192.1 hypothetical protein DES42_104278 [Zavarzinia compransoris]
MIHVVRDIRLSGLLLGLSLGALGWFFLLSPGFTDTEGPHGIALVLGGLGTLFGLPVFLNFLAAVRIRHRLLAGEGVIGRWPVRAAGIAEYQALQRQYGIGNSWKPSRAERRDGVEIVFGAETLVIGGRLLSLPTSGLQSIRGIGFEAEPALTLAIVCRAWVKVGSRLTPMDEMLRLPVTDIDEANKVMAHYRAALAGTVIVRPDRWRSRLRAGIVLTLAMPVVALAGWLWADGLRAGDRQGDGIGPLVTMLVGLLGTIAAAVFTLLVWFLHRRQRGGR